MTDQSPPANLVTGALIHQTTVTRTIPFTNPALTKRERHELDACKLSSTIVWKGRKQPRIDDVFYSWCRRTKFPYVRIHYRRSHADIFMDLPGAGSLDLEGIGQLRALCLNYGLQCDSIKSTHPIGLPTAKAEEFAKRLVEIGLSFCGRYRAEQDAPYTESYALNVHA